MTEYDSPKKMVQDLQKNIALHQSLGIEHYPRSREIMEFFENTKEFIEPSLEILPQAPRTKVPIKEKKISPPQIRQTLADIRRELGDCTRCSLHESRTRILFGAGNVDADLFIVGEAPTPYDDAEGVIFGGEEGELLTKMLRAINIDISEVYLANIVKCRVPADSVLQSQQINTCQPFLASQIEVVSPKVICAMGTLAGQSLLKTSKQLISLRGRFHNFNGVAVMPTFHPSYLLKNPEMKKATWVDLQLIQQKLKTV